MKKRLLHKRVALSVIALLLATYISYGQAEWTWQNPIPGSVTFWTVEVFDANTVYVFGDDGEWLKTTDGGSNWANLNHGVKERFLASSFIDQNTGWIVSLQGTMLKTTDGGNSWTTLSTGLTSPQFSAVFFVDENIGWATGLADAFPVIIKTTDGGATWTEQSHSSFTQSGFSTLYFEDENTGFAGGHNNEIFKTTDGGTTWTLKTTQDPALDFSSFVGIDFVSDTKGYAQRDDTTFVTNDGGETWALTAGQPRWDQWTYMMSIDFWDEDHGYTTDNYGGLIYTDDGGATWIEIYRDPDWNSAIDIEMHNSTTGFVVGIGLVANTTDGSNWSSQVKGPKASLRSIKFIDNAIGWTVGNDGTILHTTNCGNTWNEQTSGTSERLSDISIASDVNVWVVGQNGTVLKTTDGGTNWVSQSSGTSQHLNNVHIIDVNEGWVVGDTSTILHTIDGGATWTSQTSPVAANLSGLSFTSTTKGWTTGTNGTILHTNDGGSSWSAQPSGTIRDLNSVHFINNAEGWAVGDTATILHTSDGGATWTAQTSPVTFLYEDISDGPIDLYEVQFLDENNGFIVGRYGYFFTTEDGGQTWTYQETQFIYSLSLTDINTGWVSGYGGVILKYEDSRTIAEPLAAENEITFSYTVYPNPVTDHFNVEFTSTTRESITIEIISLATGQTLSASTITAKAGKNVWTWQVSSSVANGLYLCRMKTAKEIGTKKLIIIR